MMSVLYYTPLAHFLREAIPGESLSPAILGLTFALCFDKHSARGFREGIPGLFANLGKLEEHKVLWGFR